MIRTLDFTNIRELLDYELISSSKKDGDEKRAASNALVATIASNLPPAKKGEQGKSNKQRAKNKIARLSKRIQRGQNID